MNTLANKGEIALQDGHPDYYLNAVSESNPNVVEITENLGEDELPWFNQMNKGIEQAAIDFDADARQLGLSTLDPTQQVKIIEN